MKRLTATVLLVSALLTGGCARVAAPLSSDDQAIAQDFKTQASDVEVRDTGVVTSILPDDTNGSRHQRFIVTLDSGQTLEIAHNIDIAPRLEPLAKGDRVEFLGEYVWNDQGGVVHWTHHDPSGKHSTGWLKSGSVVVQ